MTNDELENRLTQVASEIRKLDLKIYELRLGLDSEIESQETNHRYLKSDISTLENDSNNAISNLENDLKEEIDRLGVRLASVEGGVYYAGPSGCGVVLISFVVSAVVAIVVSAVVAIIVAAYWPFF